MARKAALIPRRTDRRRLALRLKVTEATHTLGIHDHEVAQVAGYTPEYFSHVLGKNPRYILTDSFNERVLAAIAALCMRAEKERKGEKANVA